MTSWPHERRAGGLIVHANDCVAVEEDVDAVIETLPGILDKLRALSPFWAGADTAPKDFKPVYA